MKKRIALIFIIATIAVGMGCGPKIIIPEFNTAKEQYEFAKMQKDNSLLARKDRREERYTQAILAFKKVIEKFPEDKQYCSVSLISIGECYYWIDKFSKSAETYEEALKLYSNLNDIRPFALYGVALSYDHLKEYEKAQYYYKTLLDAYEKDQRNEVQDVLKKAKAKYSKVKVK